MRCREGRTDFPPQPIHPSIHPSVRPSIYTSRKRLDMHHLLSSYSRMWVSALAIASISVVSSLIDEVGGWRVALFHGRGGRPKNQGVEWSACLLIILTIGLVLFTQFEGLSPSDSIYFSIITSTTIGYGDFKPATQTVHHQCRQSFAFNIFGNDQQWTT